MLMYSKHIHSKGLEIYLVAKKVYICDINVNK
jgi:hypothetical protein